MRRKILFSVLAVCMLVSLNQAAQAAIVFQDLGTVAPPATLGNYAVAPFDQVPQTAIPDATDVTTIPGSPIPGDLTVSPALNKRTIGSGWATWSHGYTGAVYVIGTGGTATMTLPAGAGAFYFYAEPNSFALMTINATANDGTTSGDITVNGSSGANGFAFYATGTTSTITSITVTSSDASFAIGEFGIAVQGAPGAGNSFVFPAFPAICGVPGASSICVVE